jgi:hypothetical protein
VFREAGYVERQSMHAGVMEVELDIGGDVTAPSGARVGTPRPRTAQLSARSVLSAVRAVTVVCGGPAILLLAVGASVVVASSAVLAGRMPPPLTLVVLAAAAAYVFVFLPWTRRWGTVPGERSARLPGDEFVPRAGLQMTRAVTIDAHPDEVWAWLAQIGADRGGFYSYSWLENLAGCHLRNADAVHPEWRHRRVGDVVMLHPLNGLPITRIEAPWSFSMGGWYFALEARPGGRTRLLARTRVPKGVATWAYALFVELPHFVMERKMLLRIRARSERGPWSGGERASTSGDAGDRASFSSAGDTGGA